MAIQTTTGIGIEDWSALNEAYTKELDWHDLVVRALRNQKMSPVYVRLYLALVDTYPGLLSGEKVEIEAWRVRENAGWAKERITTSFFQDMAAINAFVYDPGKYNKKESERVGSLLPNPHVFPYPEGFDTNGVDRKRKAREQEEKRRKQFKNPRQLLQCTECGSEEIFYDVTPYCMACGHAYETIKSIPASEVTIDAEIIEIADDFFASGDEPTAPRLAAVSAPVQQLPMTPLPLPSPRLGRHRDGWICDRCGQADKFVSVPTTWGGTIDVCTCSQE